MKFPIVTRAQAHAQGLKRFYNGKPCKYGHDAQRFVSTGVCCACNAARSKIFSRAKASDEKVFSYHLHPDDVAAALAYCQALDIQRGRVPFSPDAPARGAEPAALPADIERHRATLIASYSQPSTPDYLPKP